MVRGGLRSKQNHQFAAGAAYVSRTNGKNGMAGLRVLQQEFNSLLLVAEVVDIFVSRFANARRELFAGDAGNGIFARRINVRKDEQVGLVKRFREVVPKVLRARVA